MSPTITQLDWICFREMIVERFPHATLYGLRIERGVAMSYQRARFTKVFDRVAAVTAPPQAPQNERWAGFIRFCAAVGTGTLPEVHFRDGNPCLAQLEEPGQDLKVLPRN